MSTLDNCDQIWAFEFAVQETKFIINRFLKIETLQAVPSKLWTKGLYKPNKFKKTHELGGVSGSMLSGMMY